MERESREILASQKKMLDHRGETSKISDEEMEQQFRNHLSVIKPWLVRQPNMELLYINYNALLVKPESFCEQIEDFPGPFTRSDAYAHYSRQTVISKPDCY